MAVVLKINPGFDASYPWREIGTGSRPEPASGLDYYLAPADKGGEPAGRWAGRGLPTLGFAAGQVIDRKVFEPLYGEHLDPRDPAGKTRLGRAAQRFTPEQVIFGDLAAAEPHASPARLAELRTLAKAQARHAVPFWDVTVSVSKSITLFYGGLLAVAEQARRSGDAARAEYLERRAGRVWAAIMEGNRAALEFLQDEAGMTRTGYHRGSGTESGAELGKWEHARNWVIGSFRQHTSRDGDPQLHVHNLVLNKVETERDGKWRKLDSRSLYRFQGAAAAIAAAVMETALTREFGVAWMPRADGHGREIAGIGQELMDAFSSRRQAITADARAVAAEREAQTGRRPDARQMYRIQKDIAYRTRAAKPETPLDIRAKLRKWEQKAREKDLGELSAIPGAVAEAARVAREREQQQAELDAAPEVLRVARAIAWELARQHGQAPDAEQFRRINRFARFITLNGADTRPVDPALLLKGWEAQERADAEAQRQIRREIARAQARSGALPGPAPERARAVVFPAPPRRLSEDQARSVMAEAIAVTQARISAWTRADLIRYLGETLPAGILADRRALETLAARALGGAAGEQVELLSAPEWPRVPDGLRRVDGESVFRPHGAERYASQAQLSLEEQLLAHAREPGAPRLDAETAARLLGADPERLQAQLQPGSAAAAEAGTAGSGLRLDQAAAAWYVLTSPRRAEVMVGPAGTGKTCTAIEMARAWQQAGMGPVVALTASSNARNVLREEAARRGVAELACYNTAEWLGHAEGAREARDPIGLAPGTLITLDEASMMPIGDLAAVLRRAAAHGAKVVVTGDPMQLQAVEGGGGMALLTRHLGHVQLSEASRFRHGWERQATLRLRDGDVTVLTDYRLHDRLHVGPCEEMLEDAARAYLHDRLAGKDTLLMAGTEAMAAELSRRVREDLIRWGIVSDGPAVRLRDGARASAGDWIMARKNDATTKASQRGRTLVNRDILRLVDADPYGTGMSAQVVRLMGREESGRERWSAPFLVSRSYLWNEAQLGYAVTFHAAEGRTVDSAIAVFSGEEDRQAAYVALSRGRENNEAYVIAGWRIADPRPGPRPAPELARQERLDREHAGIDDAQQARLAREGITAEQVLSQCLGRDRQQLSATDTRAAEWSDADRLDVLGVQWQHVSRDAAEHRYRAAVRAALTEEEARQVLADPAATWLWRTLREAEAAGLDSAAAVRRAVASGPFTDAGSVAKVLDWRIRQATDGMPALAAGSWTGQVPQTGDPDTDRYAAELAETMIGRQRRLGEHAAEHPPAWAHALGPVPEHPLDRAAWEHKAGQVAAYREMWGWTHPAEPIGPRPGPHSPEARGSWQAAAEALGRQPGDLSGHSDGQLWAWRSAFAREMAWAPPYQAEELAMVRGEIRRAQVDADRARRDAQAADIDEARQRLAERAAVAERWEEMTRDVADRLAEAQAGYDAWEAATGPTRDRAVAADAELRRRYPDTIVEPLRAQLRPQAEPVSSGSAAEPVAVLSRVEPVVAAAAEADRTPVHAGAARDSSRMDLVAERLRQISARLDEADLRAARQAREKAAEISSLYLDPDDPDGAPTPAWQSDLRARQRESVRHEPLPRVPAACAIEAEAGLRDREAAD